MSSGCPFGRIAACRTAVLAASVAVVATLALPATTLVPPASAQAIQQAAVSSTKSDVAKSEAAKPDAAASAPQTVGAGSSGSSDQADPSRQTLAAKAIDKVRETAKSASDIFNRVPCLGPKGRAKTMGSLPHVAAKLASGQPLVIVAFGSSSTAGYGATSPEFNYPNRLAAQLRRKYPNADITVINQGKGGEDAVEMMRRLQLEVIDMKPDLVIWQVGANAVLRNLDPSDIAGRVEEGVARIQAAGADIVLVDPQYSPRVNEHGQSASTMVRLLGKVATLKHVGIFPRFEVMREWHEQQSLPIESFVIADGLHMNDWGYACFAQLLGDDIIRSVGQIKLGVNVPAHVQAYRPM